MVILCYLEFRAKGYSSVSFFVLLQTFSRRSLVDGRRRNNKGRRTQTMARAHLRRHTGTNRASKEIETSSCEYQKAKQKENRLCRRTGKDRRNGRIRNIAPTP